MSDSMTIYADILPGAVVPRPEGVPAGSKLRVIVSETELIIAWQMGADANGPIINDLRIPREDPENDSVTYRGGAVAGYTVTKAGGCGCGASALRRYNPYPGLKLLTAPATGDRIYGVPPRRYSRA